MKHKFNYRWKLADGYPAPGIEKNDYKVFSCFACGGGSTMGYKLAGFTVLGCNEIDPKMINAYRTNHNPKYSFLEAIQTFKLRDDLPEELYDLDILDGSPPCSSFSMAGNREDDWGKEKKFREGQAEQVLDNLFFDFIDLAEKLQPKVVLAENVKGLIMGSAKDYVRRIHERLQEAGYELLLHPYLLDASKMGVPQKRERVFFCALRKDLAGPFMEPVNIFESAPKLELEFNEPPITFGEYRSEKGSDEGLTEWTQQRLIHMIPSDKSISDINERHFGKVSRFNALLIGDDDVYPTITATEVNYRKADKKSCTKSDYCLTGTYPIDYDFCGSKPKYLIGMSVPPVMVAQIALQIKDQWLDKI